MSQEYTSNSDVQDRQVFKKTKATTETITWTVTAGLKVPGEGKFAAELPRLADGTVMVKPELNLGVSRDTDMGSGHNTAKTEVCTSYLGYAPCKL